MLSDLQREGVMSVYSHQLASMTGNTAAQVRRDIMTIGYSGSPSRGYDVDGLVESIGRYMDAPDGQHVALVGVGNLGRALMAYFAGRRPRLEITAAFDADPEKVRRVIHGCRCYPMEDLERVIEEEAIEVAVLAVPAGQARAVADRLVRAGIRGLLNFAPVPLKLRTGVYVEDIDVTMSLEKVAFFARQQREAALGRLGRDAGGVGQDKTTRSPSTWTR
jgi:redox-sensing transcriptional repressor